jgi:hypothetical protein
MRTISVSAFLLAALAPALLAGPFTAASPDRPFNFFSTSNNLTVGWTFTVGVEPILANELGLYIEMVPPGSSQQVGIFSSTGTLLSSATVSNCAPLSGPSPDFCYTAISPLLLDASTLYVIGATYKGSTGNIVFNPAAINVHPAISYGEARFLVGSGLQFPSSVSSSQALFGPNFRFEPVPEPGTWALIGLGLISLGLVRQRSR